MALLPSPTGATPARMSSPDAWRPPKDRPTQALLAATAVFLLGLLALALPVSLSQTEFKAGLGFCLAPLFGISVGAAELVSRYRDRPVAALTNQPAALYLFVNGAAATAAFWLLYEKRLTFGVQVFGVHPVLNALVLGGFGAMALFRTAVFNVRVADTSVSIGPAAVLQIILRVTDREIDRLRAGPRAADVNMIMQGIVYSRARETLPLHCWALMQNVSLEEQNNIDQALSVLDRKTTMSDEAKTYSLGLLLMNLVGEDVLRRAVTGLGERIKGPPPDMPVVLGRAKDLSESDLPALLAICYALKGTECGSNELLIRPEGAKQDSDYKLIVLARLRRACGAETVDEALTNLIASRSTPVSGSPKYSAGAFTPPASRGGAT